MDKELSSKEKEALALLFEMDEYKALKRLMQHERYNIATKLLSIPADQTVVIAHMQGQAHALKELHQMLRKIHEKIDG